MSQREALIENNGNVTFPNIMICADSIHSRSKMKSRYPNITDEMIERLYGLNVPAGTGIVLSMSH